MKRSTKAITVLFDWAAIILKSLLLMRSFSIFVFLMMGVKKLILSPDHFFFQSTKMVFKSHIFYGIQQTWRIIFLYFPTEVIFIEYCMKQLIYIASPNDAPLNLYAIQVSLVLWLIKLKYPSRLTRCLKTNLHCKKLQNWLLSSGDSAGTQPTWFEYWSLHWCHGAVELSFLVCKLICWEPLT